jgi:hypothetical protein
MFGYRVIENDKRVKYKIASLEKTILDFLYWNPDIESGEDLQGLRWNKEQLGRLEDNPIFWKYLKIFNSESLNRRVDAVMEYIHA